MSIIIIGNGIAGLNAVEEIRKINGDVEIHLVSDEPYLTYERHKLSAYLAKPLALEEIYVQPPEWYDKMKVQLYLGLTVTGLDTEKRRVMLSDGTSLAYEKLILANGSHGFLPPVEGNSKKGVFTVRNYDDIRAIQEFAAEGKNGVIVGGGLLGLEAAWSLQQGGVNVAVLEYSGRLLPRQLDQEGSELLHKVAEGAGVQLYLGVEVARITGGESADGVELKDGRKVAADFVIFSTGVRPNLKIAGGTTIAVKRGIVVNDYMETNMENVYAAGDIAECAGKVPGIWPVAVGQGKIAGQNAANTLPGGSGKKAVYQDMPPSNTLLVMGARVFSAGEVEQKEGTTVISSRDEDNRLYNKLFFREGKITGAILFGDLKPASKVKKAMEAGKDFTAALDGNPGWEQILPIL